MTELDTVAAVEYVSSECAAVVAAVNSCADAVAASWDGDATTDATLVADRLSACLSENDVLDALPAVLVGAVDAAGGAMQTSPVAAPPYVVVTSRGPLLRATLDEGRFLVRFEAFRVTEDGRYERAASDPAVTAVVR